ncbi:glycosyltransferase family 4 protein [Thalassomonas actiniarum]|uniref:Glycosyltransferase family 4 protein n=1 Tax=Thalassomonas actiniarum TaxID=485447 RepID=A0AAE9YNS1_9GAMM|nr:glycosyltransferase family 4 protein [Thalassomonas actiniarum]WDD96827.1 glycosyltransferase family 4 protein [Thalassomonas actiniarum]
MQQGKCENPRKNETVITNKKCPVLFVHYGDEWIRGSEQCLLDLLTFLNRDKFFPVVWCNSQRMYLAVLALKIEAIYEPFPLLLGWKAPFFDINGFMRLIKRGKTLVDHYNIRLIHSNSGAPCQWLNFVARSRKLPLVAHLHSRYPLRDRLTLGLCQVSKVIAVSPPVARQLTDIGMPESRVTTVANGIDGQKFNRAKAIDLRSMLKLDKKDFLLFSTGSLIKRKGMDLVIAATDLVKKSGVPVKLIIAGGGSEQANLAAWIKQLGLEQDVFLLGERQDLPALLKGGIDIFVSGAREEAFGLVLAEAGLNALPVIAPAVGGIPFVIRHKQTGLLIPPEDPQIMAEKIIQLYRDPTLRLTLGLAGKKHTRDNFLIAGYVANIQACYLKVIDNPECKLHWLSHWVLAKPLLSLLKALGKLTVKYARFPQRLKPSR